MALTRVNYSRQGNFPIDKLPSITNDKLSGSISTAKLADNSVTTAKIADNAVTNNKTSTGENSLKPVWINLNYNAGGNSSHTFMDQYCTRIISNNGNSGPAMRGMLEGSTGTGRFMIKYIPGYMWGWSGIYMTERGGLNVDSNGDFVMSGSGWWAQHPTGKKQIWTGNNSSNNVRYCQYWNGSTNTTLLNSGSGTNGATWYIWRDSGVLRLSDSVGTTTIIASGDTTDWICSSSTEQSTSSLQILQAERITGT